VLLFIESYTIGNNFDQPADDYGRSTLLAKDHRPTMWNSLPDYLRDPAVGL